MLSPACVTGDRTEVATVVLKHAKGMKEPWCLSSSRSDLKPSAIVNLYGRRFTIEERFRDIRTGASEWGLGCADGEPTRRTGCSSSSHSHRLCYVLGAAGESLGMDRLLKVNTVKTRVHSLYRQGQTYLQLLPKCRRQRPMHPAARFRRLLDEHATVQKLFALL